jgi:hypothetical protein
LRESPARRWLAVGLVTVIGAAVGVVLATHRRPVYSSTAIVSSARLNALTEALPGYVEATTSLASTYSRIAMTDVVENQVAKRLALPLAKVRARIAATPVPDDPVLRIVALGPTSTAAQRLARATAVALVDYISGLVSSTSKQAGLLSRYASTTVDRQRLSARAGALRAAGASASGGALAADELELSKLSLRQKALTSSYVNQALDATSGATPQILTAAGPATSDRVSKIQDYGAIGLGAGLIVALAIERAAWARARARRSRIRLQIV